MGRFVGFDYSSGMLGQAEKRVHDHHWTNVKLALERAVEELRPGGRISILDFHATRPGSGIRRVLNPVFHWILRVSGADSPEDLDDDRLRERWRVGKQWLSQQLTDVAEDPYLTGVGFLLSGTRPK